MCLNFVSAFLWKPRSDLHGAARDLRQVLYYQLVRPCLGRAQRCDFDSPSPKKESAKQQLLARGQVAMCLHQGSKVVGATAVAGSAVAAFRALRVGIAGLAGGTVGLAPEFVKDANKLSQLGERAFERLRRERRFTHLSFPRFFF